jgi:hypothetical protein
MRVIINQGYYERSIMWAVNIFCVGFIVLVFADVLTKCYRHKQNADAVEQEDMED